MSQRGGIFPALNYLTTLLLLTDRYISAQMQDTCFRFLVVYSITDYFSRLYERVYIYIIVCDYIRKFDF